MSFFNSETANVIQHISVPLAIIGFYLTYIEIYDTLKANKIEAYFHIESQERVTFGHFAKGLSRGLLAIFSLYSMYYVTHYIIELIDTKEDGFYGNYGNRTLYPIYQIIGMFVGVPFYLFFLFKITTLLEWILQPIKLVASFLHYLTNGKAIGAIGLILAFFGILGGIYQIISIHFGN